MQPDAASETGCEQGEQDHSPFLPEPSHRTAIAARHQLSAANEQALLFCTLALWLPLFDWLELSACHASPRTEVSVPPVTPDTIWPLLPWVELLVPPPRTASTLVLLELPVDVDVAPLTEGELATDDWPLLLPTALAPIEQFTWRAMLVV